MSAGLSKPPGTPGVRTLAMNREEKIRHCDEMVIRTLNQKRYDESSKVATCGDIVAVHQPHDVIGLVIWEGLALGTYDLFDEVINSGHGWALTSSAR